MVETTIFVLGVVTMLIIAPLGLREFNRRRKCMFDTDDRKGVDE